MRLRVPFFCLAIALSSIVPTSGPQAGWGALPNAPESIRHDDVFFITPEIGWVVNGGGEVFKTTVGGVGWIQQAQFLDYLRSVGFASPMKGWIGTLSPSNLLYTTTNGGEVWTEVDNIPEPKPGGICGIWVVNESVVYACGRYDKPARVIKSTNGGTTWTSTDLGPLADTLIDCFFFDENNGFVVGGKGGSFSTRVAVVLGTTNGGSSWQTRHITGRPGEWCWKICFPSPQTGYASIESINGSAFVLKTTNSGLTWTETFVDFDYSAQGIGFATNDLGWLGGHSDLTYETTDGGDSWHLAGFGQQINRFRMLSASLGYAVGSTVYKYTAGGPTDVSGGDAAWSGTLAVGQNYPNPFRGSTSLRYSLAHEADLEVTLHDVSGRQILTLLHLPQAPGDHEISWNGRDPAGRRLPSGVYLFRLKAGEAARTKRVVLAWE